MKLRNIIMSCILAFPTLGLWAECDGWSVNVGNLPSTICTAKNIELTMSVLNDTAELLTCDYRWFIKKPSATAYEQISTTSSVSYLFNEVGVFRLYAEAKPNECTDYMSSSVVSIELYPATLSGTISSDQTICYNSKPNSIAELVGPTGGDENFTRQWQQSLDGTSWSNISGATSNTFAPTYALTETTQYRLLYSNSCTSVTSNEITITVRSPHTAPIISSDKDILCYNENTATLTCTTEATGGLDETFEYRWQVSSDGSNFLDIVSATGLTYTTPLQTSSRWYRVVATSEQGCGSIASPSKKIDVYPDWVITNSTSVESLCYMSGGVISVSVTGEADNYLYQWQEFDGSVWNDIPSANAATYNIPGKISGTYKYRALVAPANGCASKYSDTFSITVYEDLTANVIAGVDTVCYNHKPGALSQTLAPTGGNEEFTYQWQKKTSGAWSDIEGATTTTYQPDALTSTTYYRLKASTSCGSTFSNEIEIYVRKNLTAPIITSTAETICYGFAPALISIPTLATCDVYDSLTYQWQQRTSGDWQNIPGATALTYQPESITTTHQYRVIASSVKGCGSRESNVRTVNVYDDLQITTTGISPLCYMTRGTIRVTASGEGGLYEYQWQDSVEGAWADVIDGNSQQYLTQPKTQGDYFYRCIVTPSLGCIPDTSATIKVQVYDSVTPVTISINGTDTICYGFVPSAISIETPASGGDGTFSYHWMHRQEGVNNFSYISGATGTSYKPTALYKTTEYQLEVTNACDVKYTNIVRIYVRDEMQAPILAEHHDTICYNTVPSPIITTTLPTGGEDDSFTYQWEMSLDGQTFTDIIGEITTTYQPEALLESRFYRLRASSVKACGDIVSNIVKVNVYDSLLIQAISPDTLCYMTPTTLFVSTNGGGNKFTYQWQDSVNGTWKDISGATYASYETEPRVKGNYYYRCIVSSSKCENYSRISPIVKVSVYEALNPGTITGIDSTCYGFAPAGPIHVDIAATGVDGNYSYQWQVLDDEKWKDIEGELGTFYQPEALFTGADYRLKVIAKCDTLYTNNYFIRVNQLPAIQPITGPDSVCYNQHEIYIVEKLNQGFTYEWLLERGEGILTTEAVNATFIDVLWKNPNSTDSVILRVTNDITGCERDLKFGVSICNEQAPERTIIVRKPNSNILVCQEDGQLVYQWGYTEKSSQQEFIIDDSNHRYVLLPHTFDDLTYDYWLTLRHSESSRCYSRSYYAPENDAVINPSVASISVPSFVSGRIPIEIQNPNVAQINCSIYNLSGELVAQYNLGDAQYISTMLPVMLHTGMYVMHVSMGEYVKSIKLIAE